MIIHALTTGLVIPSRNITPAAMASTQWLLINSSDIPGFTFCFVPENKMCFLTGKDDGVQFPTII